MKFDLEFSALGMPDEKLLEDLKRVAKLLNKHSVTYREYDAHGNFSASTLLKRFGGWVKALELAGLSRPRSILNIPRERLLADLLQVAKKLGKNSVTMDEYDAKGQYSASTIAIKFGSWFNALDALGLERTRNLGITDEDYFKNLEEIWIKLGRQPRYRDLEKPLSKYSSGAYEHRFGSWRKALEAFVAYANAGEKSERTAQSTEPPPASESTKATDGAAVTGIVHRTSRYISDRLRFLVMRRDKFRCNYCGRSPATHAGLELVVDHVKAWAKGGETEYDNLQTLCRPCNGGKGDLGQSE